MAWYLIIVIVLAYLLIGAAVCAFLEEASEHETDTSTVILVIFWPIVIVGTLMLLVFEGIEIIVSLVRRAIKKILKQ